MFYNKSRATIDIWFRGLRRHSTDPCELETFESYRKSRIQKKRTSQSKPARRDLQVDKFLDRTDGINTSFWTFIGNRVISIFVFPSKSIQNQGIRRNCHHSQNQLIEIYRLVKKSAQRDETTLSFEAFLRIKLTSQRCPLGVTTMPPGRNYFDPLGGRQARPGATTRGRKYTEPWLFALARHHPLRSERIIVQNWN